MYSSGSCFPCNYFNRIGYQVSRWCPTECTLFPTPELLPGVAYFTQAESFSVPAGGAIPFNGSSLIGEGFMQENGRISIAPGVYRVDYRILIPQADTVNTTFSVQVGGVDVAGTQQSVSHAAGSEAMSVAGNAILEVTKPTTLSLVSSNALTLTAPGTGEALATLTMMAL